MAKSRYTIEEHFATLSENRNGYSLELNYVTWGSYQPKYDLRMWRTDADGLRTALKGVTMNAEQFAAFRTALDGLEVVEGGQQQIP